MSILKVARLGHPSLRKVAQEIPVAEIRQPTIQKLIKDMFETMAEYGGVGLAAPQVHESLRLAIIGVPTEDGEYVSHIMINPKLEVTDQELQENWEGCLSVPGFRGLVARPTGIKVTYYDENAAEQTMIATDFTATVIQHELDHLDGVVYVDKIAHPHALAFEEEFQRYYLSAAAEDSDEELPEHCE